MKKILILLISLVLSTQYYAQGWIGNTTTNQLYSVNGASPPSANPLFVGIGTNNPTHKLHTDGTLRFQNLIQVANPNTTHNQVLTTDAAGDVRWIPLGNLTGGGGNAWLLGGNTLPTPSFIGTLNGFPFDIHTVNIRRARYDINGNYDLGLGNTINSTIPSVLSQRSSIFGHSNSLNSTKDAKVQGTVNFMTQSHSSSISGDSNTMTNSSASHIAGRLNIISTGIVNSISGYSSAIVGQFGSFNTIAGNMSSISNSDLSHNIGNENEIIQSARSYAFGDTLMINNNTNPTINGAFAFGQNISNETSNSMRFGFNNRRALSLTQRGMSVMMSPASSTYLPTHNFEVEAAHPIVNSSNIQFANLPTTTDNVEQVVYNPVTHEIFRRAFQASGGGVSSSCSTQFFLPKVSTAGSSALGCSGIMENASGQVGIGTTTPGNKVEINSGTANTSGLRFSQFSNIPFLATNINGDVVSANTSATNSFFWTLNGNANTNPSNNFIGTTDNNRLVFRTNNIPRVTVMDNRHSVGINHLTPTANLDINNSACDNQPAVRVTKIIDFTNPNPCTNNGDFIICQNLANNTPTTIFRVTENTQVGIGIDPHSTLHSNGSFATKVIVKNSTTTLDLNASVLHTVIHTAGAATYNLPAANSYPGRQYIIMNHGTGNITFNLGYTVANGVSFTTLSNSRPNNFVTLISDGSVWRGMDNP